MYKTLYKTLYSLPGNGLPRLPSAPSSAATIPWRRLKIMLTLMTMPPIIGMMSETGNSMTIGTKISMLMMVMIIIKKRVCCRFSSGSYRTGLSGFNCALKKYEFKAVDLLERPAGDALKVAVHADCRFNDALDLRFALCP